MNLFKRLVKPKKEQPVEQQADSVQVGANQPVTEKKDLLSGLISTWTDILAPGGIDRSDPDLLKVGPVWARTLAVTGFPSAIDITWLQPFLDHEGELDLSLHIFPYDDRVALANLTRLITRYRAEFRFVQQYIGASADVAKAADDAERIRELVSRNQSRMFQLTTLATVYHKKKDEVLESSDLLDSRLATGRIYSKGLETRQDEAYLSTLPFGLNLCSDTGRLMDSYALSTAFPFTSSDLVQPGGYQLGINLNTQAPIIYNPYLQLDHNIVVYAASGSGKSATVKTMVARSVFTGERTCILDPEGEYRALAEYVGGVYLPIGPGSPYHLNPFDISEETLDDGTTVVDLNTKILDLAKLVQTMVGVPSSEDVAATELSIIERSLREVYRRFGITRSPESLYENGPAQIVDGQLFYGRQRKRMPQFSDFVEVLGDAGPTANRIRESMGPYVGDGVLSFFDHQTNINTQIEDALVTVFDISELDANFGRPVALQLILAWLWDGFASKNVKQKKRVVVDEAWLLANETIPTGMDFLENMVRRARKRTTGLTVISQDFRKFALHPQGQSIHSNSSTFILMRAREADLDDIQRTFHLSQGERQFIASSTQGEGILRVQGRVIPFKVLHTEGEQAWAYTSPNEEVAKARG